MMHRQSRDSQAVSRRQRESTEARPSDASVKSVRNLQLSDRHLDPDLSEGNDTEEQIVGCFDGIDDRLTKTPVTRELPQHDVRVQK